MKYSDYRSQSRFKGSAAFYIIIACCLIAIGGAAWFAAASINKRDIPKTESSQAPDSSYYSSPDSSIISEPPAVTPSNEVGKAVSDEPYSSEKGESSEENNSAPQTPVFSMPVGGEVIKDYSDKQLQYSATYGDMRIHTGIDIACEDGTSVSAAGNGSVINVEESSFLGITVMIDHGNGITTKYASLKDVKVIEGDKVTSGDIIGTVTTVPGECADQSHLHFEVFKNGHSAAPLSTLGLN